MGGGAGAASLAIRAAIAEALPEDLGVFAAAFSFLAASSLAFAFAIISATPILAAARRRSEVLGAPLSAPPFYAAASAELFGRVTGSTGRHPGPRVRPEAGCGPLKNALAALLASVLQAASARDFLNAGALEAAPWGRDLLKQA